MSDLRIGFQFGILCGFGLGVVVCCTISAVMGFVRQQDRKRAGL
jgi:hypothetical protein